MIVVNRKLIIKNLVFFESKNIIGIKNGMYETRTPNRRLMMIPSIRLFFIDELFKILIK